MNTRRNDILGNLSPSQQAKLQQWLKTKPYDAIVQLVAQPEPEGFGIKTSDSALSRYYQKHMAAELLEDLADFAQTLANLGGDTDAIIKQILQRDALRKAAAAELTDTQFRLLSRFHHHQRDDFHKSNRHQLAQQNHEVHKDRLAHHVRVFQFNAARAALIHAAKLQDILQRTGLDNEQKIWLAHETIFGPSPESQSQSQSQSQSNPQTQTQLLQ